MFKRVIVKMSGEGLAGDSGGHFHGETVARIVGEVDGLVSRGAQVGLVVGGGNFWRGRDAAEGMDMAKAHQIGMLASVMNGLYLAEAFRMLGARAKAVVMTAFGVGAFTERFTKEAALACMLAGGVPIFAGGTGLPFFSTDAIAAVRACELEAEAVLFAKNIGCVYDGDPKENPGARKYKTVSYETVLAKRLGVADLSAIDIMRGGGVPAVVFALSLPGGIIAACENDGGLFGMGGTYAACGAADEYYEE